MENCARHAIRGDVFLAGGLCDCPYMVQQLSARLGVPVYTDPMARYAGAMGAALLARSGKKRS